MTEGCRLAVTLEAQRLVELRDRWQNRPSGRVGGRAGSRLPEAAGSPRRGRGNALKKRTLTNSRNARPR